MRAFSLTHSSDVRFLGKCYGELESDHLRLRGNPWRFSYFAAAFFTFAHLALTAAMIRALPSGLILRFVFSGLTTGAVANVGGRPGPRFVSALVRSALACLSFASSESIMERMTLVLMGIVYRSELRDYAVIRPETPGVSSWSLVQSLVVMLRRYA
jgi:hypothetical protein